MTWLIALGIGVGIFGVSLWAIRMLATPQRPEPDPDDVKEIDAHFRCTICGLRLVVTHAQDEEPEAPRHCREDMVEVGS
jgi:hypothetical protein